MRPGKDGDSGFVEARIPDNSLRFREAEGPQGARGLRPRRSRVYVPAPAGDGKKDESRPEDRRCKARPTRSIHGRQRKSPGPGRQ